MDLIFERPAMYLGFASVVRMEAFIQGYGLALFDAEKGGDPLYNGFAQWLVDRRGLGQYSWSSIVTMMGGSEAAAFELAKDFWNEYKKAVGEISS